MKHLWVKASTEVFTDGGKSIQYACEDFPGVFVYSNAVYIPHTYDNGRWLYRSFAIETPLGFLTKEFRTLKEAERLLRMEGLKMRIGVDVALSQRDLQRLRKLDRALDRKQRRAR